jgi:hypothetical protein
MVVTNAIARVARVAGSGTVIGTIVRRTSRADRG